MTGQCFQEKEHVLKHGEAIDQKFVDLKQMPMKHRHFIVSYLLPLLSCFVIKSSFFMTLESTDIIIIYAIIAMLSERL